MHTRFAPQITSWLPALPGAAAGLFLARVALEATGWPCPAILILPLGLFAASVGLILARQFSRRIGLTGGLWPLAILGLYVFWPRRDPQVALSIAILTILIWALNREPPALPRWVEQITDGATFAAAFAIYALTLAPDVLPADSGEFQLVAARLGVAHPPGYPLYTMAGWLFIRLWPFGTPAYRLNMMSAALAAGTLVFLARATRLWARRLGASPATALGGGIAAALALGSATTFWAQATIANIRTPTAFFAALAFYALARFASASDRQEADRALTQLGLALGLGLGHHPSLGFIAFFFGLYVLLIQPRLILQPQRWWRPAATGLASLLLPLLYLPIRGAADAPLAPEGLDTLAGFLWHVTAQGFKGDMFAFANAADLPHRLALLPTLFLFQVNLPLLAAALLGLAGLARRDGRLFALLTGSLVLHAFVTITYRAPQTVEYLMPAYLPLAVSLGLLPAIARNSQTKKGGILAAIRASTPRLLCSLTLWSAILNGWAHAPSYIELAHNVSTRQTVEPLLETAPASALVLADWHWATPLWYLQQVEGRRPDVEVRYVWPVAGEEYSQTWLRLVQENASARPLLLTHAYDFAGYTAEPWEAGFLVRQRPVAEPTAPLTSSVETFGDLVQLIGYSLPQEPLHPGQAAEITLAWRAVDTLEVQPSFTLRLLDAAGNVRAQADRALSIETQPGEAHFERLTLPLYPALSPGRYQLRLGAYTTTAGSFQDLTTRAGETTMTLTDLTLDPLLRPPFTLHNLSIPFVGAPTLIGVDYDRSVSGILRIYMHWQGPTQEEMEVHVRSTEMETAILLPPIPAGAYQTIAADLNETNGPLWASLTDAQGQAQTAAGPWGWVQAEARLPDPVPDARFVPLGDAMALVGASAHPAAAGDTMIMDLTLVSLRPLVSDNRISVRLLDADGRWLAADDGQPALGAIPTLKWLSGSKVMDRHLLQVPEDFEGETVQAALAAYDGFRMTPLPALDGRFGDIVPLGLWPQPAQAVKD